MGAVRHRELIRLVSFAVALNMAVGVVAAVMRSEAQRAGAGATQFAGSSGIPLDTENDGILAGGKFNGRRRGSPRPSTSQAAQGPATSAPTTPSVATPTPTAPSPTTGAPPATTASTRPAPATTASTQGSPSTTGATRGGPGSSTTATSRSPGTTAGPTATTPTSGPSAAASRQGHDATMTDPAGDTFVDGTQQPIKQAKADIVRARTVYDAGKITFTMQVDQPTDPRTDAKWASEATFAQWSVDTTGDRQPDFEIQYYFDSGQLGGTVTRPGTAEPELICEASSAGYDADGYSLTIAPVCLGNPASFSYRLSMYYDTNPKDENADVASDVTPNGGLSFPVVRPN